MIKIILLVFFLLIPSVDLYAGEENIRYSRKNGLKTKFIKENIVDLLIWLKNLNKKNISFLLKFAN